MGRATEKKPTLVVSDEDSGSEMSMEDDEDDDDDGDEEDHSEDNETPDLYRNSALGMWVLF